MTNLVSLEEPTIASNGDNYCQEAQQGGLGGGSEEVILGGSHGHEALDSWVELCREEEEEGEGEGRKVLLVYSLWVF